MLEIRDFGKFNFMSTRFAVSYSLSRKSTGANESFTLTINKFAEKK